VDGYINDDAPIGRHNVISRRIFNTIKASEDVYGRIVEMQSLNDVCSRDDAVVWKSTESIPILVLDGYRFKPDMTHTDEFTDEYGYPTLSVHASLLLL
jgi:hypothetical protein